MTKPEEVLVVCLGATAAVVVVMGSAAVGAPSAGAAATDEVVVVIARPCRPREDPVESCKDTSPMTTQGDTV